MLSGVALLLVFLSVTIAAEIPLELFSGVIPRKVLATAQTLNSHPDQYPHVTDKTSPGQWDFQGVDWWTSGYFPATLYALNTRKSLCPSSEGIDVADWILEGQSASTRLMRLTNGNGQGHDQGFLSFPFVHELELHPDNSTAADATLKFANILAGRFVPEVGATRSWDSSNPDQVTVIIDNMVNLELLFIATDLTGNTTYADIATTHADTTMNNHIRDDGSTWHVVEYNASDGSVISRHTAQGYSDDSTWARGQAWSIFGFANVYKRTGDTAYLETARRLANYFIGHTPTSTWIVPWDFLAPTNTYQPSDTSAAMIAAQGLLMLASQETSSNESEYWIESAIQILSGAVSFAFHEEDDYASLLSNGTVNKPQNNFDTGIVYGDYHFIQTGNALVSMGLADC